MAKADLTAQRLREIVDYDPKTGVFRRRIATGRTNQHTAGVVLGTVRTRAGHLSFCVDGKDRLAHRLAWLYMLGEWPKKSVDHINGNPCDNSWSNLREVTPKINSQNQRSAHLDNKTGFLGVHAYRSRFVASLTIDGKTKHLGVFDTPEQAHAAYVEAKRSNHAGSTL